MMSKRVVILTMSNGAHVIGELEPPVCDIAKFRRPCILVFQSASNVQIVEVLRPSAGMPGIFAGEFVEVNMRQVQWTATPAEELATAWRKLISGLILPIAHPGPAVNQ
jgi:hypothetical protein